MIFLRHFLPLLAVVAGVLLTTGTAQAAEPPKWILDAAAGATPDAPTSTGAPAKVVSDDTTYVIGETGTLTRTQRVVLVLRNKSGASLATARLGYLEGGDVVKRADAWLVRAGKIVRNYGVRDWLDVNTASEGTLVSDGREKFISLESFATPGDVFAYETRVEGRLLFATFDKGFGWEEPVQLERFQLQLPAGFTLDHATEGSPLEASVSADQRTYTWSLRESPYLKSESWSDPAVLEHPRLRLRVRPPAGTKHKFAPPVFLGWADVARWEIGLHEGYCDSSPALQATVARVLQGQAGWLDRVRALCEYAQSVRYIALSRGLNRGFGYRPRKASVVHSTGYGDCKDKSNLLCSLLREIGVKAYPVGVLAGFDEPPVNAAWPTPSQFNHAIVAIEAPEDFHSPAVTSLADGRRLLIFDPTDEDTPLGGLPWSLQGSFGQVVAEGVMELVRLPAMPEAEQYHGRNTAQLKLKSDGSAEGTARADFHGQYASRMRSRLRPLSELETKERILRGWSDTLRGTQLKKVERLDQWRDGSYAVIAEFQVPAFVQPLRETLALVRLDLFNRDSVPVFTEKTRRTPLRIWPKTYSDEVSLELPEGMAVDELPQPARIESRFGTLTRTLAVKERTVVMNREFRLRDCRVPVAEYAALRQFLADCAKADRAAVILRR